jgi:hypothetical protein
MMVLHVIWEILVFSFWGLMALGAICEFREYQARLRRPARIGKKQAKLAKFYRINVVRLKTQAEARREYHDRERAKSQARFNWSAET